VAFPRETAIGALCHAISDGERALNFQPQNINFGILGGDVRAKRETRAAAALESLEIFLSKADPFRESVHAAPSGA